MSKEKLSFNKLAASGAVVAGCLGYCGIVGLGITALSASDAWAIVMDINHPMAKAASSCINHKPIDPVYDHVASLIKIHKQLSPASRTALENAMAVSTPPRYPGDIISNGNYPGLDHELRTLGEQTRQRAADAIGAIADHASSHWN
ncbi:MAG: hypothetical protein LBL30_01255 [Holosporales bacterium]|jgi:hypothetical protein|nr:hypothetical protein [Holosporales bacterium]